MGNEHLTTLHESYLQLLAQEQRFQYLRLEPGAAGVAALGKALQRRPLARAAPALASLRPALGVLALASLICAYAGAVHAAARGWARRRYPQIQSRVRSAA